MGYYFSLTTVNIGPKSDFKGKGKAYGSGKETLRFRKDAPAIIETVVSVYFIILLTT